MPLELSTVKRRLQDHLQEGLLIVVGSGLSAAEGIPGMASLAEHLKREIPPRLAAAPDPAWGVVAAALDAGDNLEAAMGNANLLSATVEMIVAETAQLISAKERNVFAKVLAGERELPFTPFVKHLFKAGKKFHLITTNYDRLIEFAAEAAEIGVDSRFFGYLHGRSDPKRSADAHRVFVLFWQELPLSEACRACASISRTAVSTGLKLGRRLSVVRLKPEECRSSLRRGRPSIRESFRVAFDDQRNAGNRAASTANRLLFIGYGFNDDHLEQYLCPNLKLTKPTVIVTRSSRIMH